MGNLIHIPFAHAEGRFVIPEKLLNELIVNHQTVFRYGDYDGNFISEFPTNPNGSIYNLAAVCNPQGNVMAIMPHPERTLNGDCIFTSMREYILDNNSLEFPSLKYSADEYEIKHTENLIIQLNGLLNRLLPTTKQFRYKIHLTI